MQSEFREGRDAKICIDDADASVVAAVLKYAYTSEYDGAQACAVLTACGQHIDPWNRVRDGGKKHFTHCMDSLFAKTPTYLVFMQHVWERQLHRFRLHWQDKRKKQDVEVKKMDFNLCTWRTLKRLNAMKAETKANIAPHLVCDYKRSSFPGPNPRNPQTQQTHDRHPTDTRQMCF